MKPFTHDREQDIGILAPIRLHCLFEVSLLQQTQLLTIRVNLTVFAMIPNVEEWLAGNHSGVFQSSRYSILYWYYSRASMARGERDYFDKP